MPSQYDKRRQRQIMAEIAKIGFCMPGSLVSRTSRCGSPTCACHTDPNRLHGPYSSWTRKMNGKTVTRNLSAAQVERYAPWFANAKRLRELIGELEALSSTVAAVAEQWDVAVSPGATTRPHRDPRGSGDSRDSSTAEYP
ncbi:MAG: hypothetical protein M0Z42_06020 [Actinomycetota bacterium]|jgi:hypothetical protein|nr:hypothetical protein [Actinomycetota bacterium]